MAEHDRSMQWICYGARFCGLFVIGAMLLASGLIGRWLAKSAGEYDRAREQATAAIAHRAAIDRRLIELKQNVAEATLECDTISASLPQGPQESKFIAQLAGLAEETGVEIDGFRPGRKLDYGDGVGELEMKLFCEGSYESLRALFEQTPKLNRLIHIANMRLSPLDQSGSRIHAELQLQLLFRTEAIHAK